MSDTPLPIYGTDPQCDGCGACCFGTAWPPYADGESVPRRITGIIRQAKTSQPNRREDGPCLFLNRKLQCDHYDNRPRVCQEFIVNEAHCTKDRRRHHYDYERENMLGGTYDGPGTAWNGTGTTGSDGTRLGDDRRVR